MEVKLEDITTQAEKRIVHIARVSNPNNQDNPEYEKLLRYCIEHKHWSVFEQAFMTVEITTSLAIAAQLLRHRSFTFQQFSTRYSNPLESGLTFEKIGLRKQGTKNRQGSYGALGVNEREEAEKAIDLALTNAMVVYETLLELGVARECARMVLPQALQTKMYMSGNIRSWIHYIDLRTQPDTQEEHREVALEIRRIFSKEMPTIAEAMEWEL